MASRDIDYQNNLNMNGHQIRNVVIEKVATLPTSTEKYDGKFVYLTAIDGDNQIGLYFCKADVWTMLGTGGDVTALETRVAGLETTVGDSEAGLVHDVADIESKYATKVSATAGTGLKTTINAEGIVTSVASAGTSDLSDWATVDAGLVHVADLIGTSAGASDAGKAIKLNAQGKVDNTMIPPLAIGELIPNTPSTYANLITLSTAEKGDIAKVTEDTDANKNGVYFLTGDYATASNWIQIVGPSNVISVNGASGIVTIGVNDLDGITQAQKDAINSGITATKVAAYDAFDEGKVDAFATVPTAGKVVLTKADANALDVASATIGSATKPVYLSDGAIVEGTQIGDAGYLGKTVQGSDTGSKFSGSSTDANVPTDKAVYTALETKVDKVTGYSLVDDAEISKLAGIEAGAQVNVIESVKVNGTALPITAKAVDVTVPTDNADLANGAGYQTATDVATAIAGIFKTATVNTTANTDTTVTGVTVGKTPKFVQVFKNGEVVHCYVAIASGSIIINTASAQTGLTVNWIE